MKDGNVISAKVLPIVTRLMGERATTGVTAYQQTTGFQHRQFSNAFSDLVLTLGEGGFDKGMARIFKTLAEAMNSSEATIKKYGAAFNTVSMAFEGIVKHSTNILNFFTDLGGQFGAILPIGLALFKLLGVKGSIFGLLLLALEDLDVYVRGGDSVLGRFINYMTDLTGMDWNAISVGIGLVGLAITAAFAPITAAVLGIGALVTAYKYLESLKAKEKPINPLANKLPTSNELAAQEANNAGKAWDTSPSWGTGLDVFRTNANALALGMGLPINEGELSLSLKARSSNQPYANLVSRLSAYNKQGTINDDEFQRATAALGGGFSKPEAIEAWLSNRINPYTNNNKPFYQEQAPVMQFSGDIILPNVTEPKDFANSLMNFYTGNGTAIK